MMRIYTVDSFTKIPFSGNPAAVCILEEEIDDVLKQRIAAEMNLSETAFVIRNYIGFGLRWFTPSTEVDLCGHATLASAHILWESGKADDKTITFHTASGKLSAWKDNDGIIRMEFPAEEVTTTLCPKHINRGLNTDILYCGKNRMDYLVEVGSEQIVRDIEPDLSVIERIESRGLIITARSNSDDYDFVSRFFAPQSGINEDPVTGSAHCALGPYWALKLDKKELRGYQSSRRGGIVYVEPEGDKVILGGNAVTVLNGNFRV